MIAQPSVDLSAGSSTRPPTNMPSCVQCKKPDQKIKPYLKANLPKRLHFANSRRIEDVSVLVELKWLFERYRLERCTCSRARSSGRRLSSKEACQHDALCMQVPWISEVLLWWKPRL